MRTTFASKWNYAFGLAFDDSTGNLYDVESRKHVINRFTPDEAKTIFATGNPWGLAFAPVPEPATGILLALGVLTAAAFRRKTAKA